MDMTIQEEIEQLVLRCIAADGLKACPKDFTFFGEVQAQRPVFYFPADRDGRQDGTVP